MRRPPTLRATTLRKWPPPLRAPAGTTETELTCKCNVSRAAVTDVTERELAWERHFVSAKQVTEKTLGSVFNGCAHFPVNSKPLGRPQVRESKAFGVQQR